jgi:hypothetical protein
MIWESADFGGKNVEHAALKVEMRIEGSADPVVMQLDTGADSNVLYGLAYKHLPSAPPLTGKTQILLGGVAARRAFHDELFYISGDFGGAGEPGKPLLIGTIGAHFFEQRILLLDFVSQRLAILEKGEDLPAEIVGRAAFTPLEYRNHKMFIMVTLNGVEQRDLFFDTGSSAMALMTTRSRWLEWTGRQPDDPANRLILSKSWGKDAKWVGAPAKGGLCVGKACVSAPMVYFDSAGLPNLDFEKYPYKTSGLFGNVPFDGRYTVIVDLPHNRFGLIEGSLAAAPGSQPLRNFLGNRLPFPAYNP